MKEERLLDIFEKIDEELITEAAPGNKPQNKKSIVWVKWGAMVASICLVVGMLTPTFYEIFKSKGAYESQDEVPSIALLYFQGALYECFDTPEGLKRVGLPSEIKPEMAGEHVAYIEMAGPVDYQETTSQTDKELFEYAPAPTRAAYVLRDGENYMIVWFCRTYFPDDVNAYTDLAEVYRFFEISNASDISSIAQTDWNRGRVIGNKVEDASAIEEFYALTTDITEFISFDEDAFQSIVFDDIPEEKQQEAHNAFADDLEVFRIETKDGLRFYIKYYPSYGYIYSGQAMAYHQVTPELEMWFKTNYKF